MPFVLAMPGPIGWRLVAAPEAVISAWVLGSYLAGLARLDTGANVVGDRSKPKVLRIHASSVTADVVYGHAGRDPLLVGKLPRQPMNADVLTVLVSLAVAIRKDRAGPDLALARPLLCFLDQRLQAETRGTLTSTHD